ncbi:hypothetical protein [Acidithiobacillus sp.]|uniref:hypothetical protein n=1 Tax=Acidithiobacillus sp. TaxID=1872118 RepID=UPI002589EE14|nr:hypothetical protein [Acidithiobacillus sp.]MDD5375020.1 hypothetical protein [Acidithiobacillus sp.]
MQSTLSISIIGSAVGNFQSTEILGDADIEYLFANATCKYRCLYPIMDPHTVALVCVFRMMAFAGKQLAMIARVICFAQALFESPPQAADKAITAKPG